MRIEAERIRHTVAIPRSIVCSLSVLQASFTADYKLRNDHKG